MQASDNTVGVIGAGIIGVLAATFLQRAGRDVFIVEAGNPGEGASFGNAGCLNGSSVVPMSMPGIIKNVPGWLSDPGGPLVVRWGHLPKLTPWLIRFVKAGRHDRVREQARALRPLLAPSVDILSGFLKEHGAETLVQRLGHLFVYRSEESWRKEHLAWELRRENGVAWDEFNADEVRQLDPNLSRAYAKGVLVRDNGHTTNPHRLVTTLLEGFLRRGGRLERTRALGFDFDGPRLKAIRTERGPVPAASGVIAAGIWSKRLASELGDRVPLESERGYHVMVRNPEVTPRIPTMDADRKFVATPMELGVRAAGTVELAGLDAPPNWRRADALLRHLHDMFPALKGTHADPQVTKWMGHRPSLPDSLPVIARARRSRDVIYAFGHGHIGMAAAPMTATLVAELVTEQPTSIDVTPFRADRFA